MALIGSGWGDIRDKSFSIFCILCAIFGTTQLILDGIVQIEHQWKTYLSRGIQISKKYVVMPKTPK